MSKKKNILLIDDEAAIRENIAEYLHEFDFNTLMAGNGAEGIQLVLEHKPDLILCDIDMPGMNGFELFRQIQQFPELSITPFIFLTAKSSAEELREGMQLGADDYITKPFKLSDVLHSINRRLEKSNRMQAWSNQKLAAITNNELVGVFFYQKDGFSFVNRKFCELTGYSETELTKMAIKVLLPFDSQSIQLEKIDMCLSGVIDNFTVETEIVSKKKTKLSANISVNYLKINNLNTLIGLVIFKDNSNVNQTSINTDAFNEIVYQLRLKEDSELAGILEKIKTPEKSVVKSNTSDLNIRISPREREILTMICQGLTNSEIAGKLALSNRTIENHRANLLNKTNSKNTAQLVSFSMKFLEINV